MFEKWLDLTKTVGLPTVIVLLLMYYIMFHLQPQIVKMATNTNHSSDAVNELVRQGMDQREVQIRQTVILESIRDDLREHALHER